MPAPTPTTAPSPALVTSPTAPTTAVNATAGNLNGSYTYKTTFVSADGESAPSPASGSVAPATQQVNLTGIQVGPAGTTSRRIYRNKGGGAYGLVATINDNTTTTLTGENATDGVMTGGAAPPVGNLTGSYSYAYSFFSPTFGETSLSTPSAAVSPTAQPVLVTGIPGVQHGMSAIRIYRSKAGSPFLRVGSVVPGVTRFFDNVADSAVVGSAPIGGLFNPFVEQGVVKRRSIGNITVAGQRTLENIVTPAVSRRNSSRATLRAIGAKEI